ncbi:ImmA/IrrE family metallo-endopeptidase [Desulfobacula sp.]|uniref:ImmA/IrrE family metallo-endopeptidase n=1 Tax=Desulfobacula sp. TaxID=2593537 RepID=UPI00260F3A2B|nr:ImmA/IrrE family metallo-endopeptidase [Desulfobacula sp.]
MNIHPVKTDQDYDSALLRIEDLWGAEPETREGDELEILLTLVTAYENENHPVPPPSPIEAIRFMMDQNGLKQVDLIPYIGSRPRVSEILNGKRNLTLKMIRCLHSQLGIPANVLIQEGTIFPKNGEDVNWDNFPVLEIIKRKWVTGLDPKTQAEEIVRSLAAQSSSNDYLLGEKAACFRKGTRSNEKDDPFSLHAWILGVLAEAKKIETSIKFQKDDLDLGFISKVAHFSVIKQGPVAVREFLLSKGIKMVVVPHFKKTYLDGGVLIDKNGTPIIALSLRYDRIDNFWFTLSHELAHLILGHAHAMNGKFIIDDLDLRDSLDETELEADRVAQEGLIPENLWAEHQVRITCKVKDVIDLSQKADVHPAIVAGRIRFENNNYRILSRQVGHKEVRKLFFF